MTFLAVIEGNLCALPRKEIEHQIRTLEKCDEIKIRRQRMASFLVAFSLSFLFEILFTLAVFESSNYDCFKTVFFCLHHSALLSRASFYFAVIFCLLCVICGSIL